MSADNLIAIAKQATLAEIEAGQQWYPRARAWIAKIADRNHMTVGQVASIVAALSPNVSWEHNMHTAEELIEGRLDVYQGYRTNLDKAKRLLHSGGGPDKLGELFPRGFKVCPFALNLSGCDDIVTVDTHAIQAAHNDPLTTVMYIRSRIDYTQYAQVYREAAVRTGYKPAEFQAIVWLVWKRLHPTSIKRPARARVQRERRRARHGMGQ